MGSSKQTSLRTHVGLHYVPAWLMCVGGFVTNAFLCNGSTVCALWFACKQSRLLENYTHPCARLSKHDKIIEGKHRTKVKAVHGRSTHWSAVRWTEAGQRSANRKGLTTTKKVAKPLSRSNTWSQMVMWIMCAELQSRLPASVEQEKAEKTTTTFNRLQ